MLHGAPVAAGLRRRGFRAGCGVAGRPSGRVGRLSCRGAAGAVLLRLVMCAAVARAGLGRAEVVEVVDRLGVGAVVGEQWYVVRVGGGGDGKVERAHLSERVGELAGELLEVFLDGPGRGCLPDLGEFGAADPVAASCGAELGDGPAGGGDRELLAGFGASQEFGDVVARFLLRDHGHGHGGGRTRGLWRFRRSRGYLLGSAEPAGAVKASSSEPSAASCAAVALTGAVGRSYRLALGRRSRSARGTASPWCRPGGSPARRPARLESLERDVLVVGDRARIARTLRRVRGLDGAAGLGAVLEVDAVQLERDALVAGLGDVFARLEAPGEATAWPLTRCWVAAVAWASQTIRST